MNATNPFQVPACFQNSHEFRRRERFKRTFVAVVSAGTLLLVGLLIEGCMSEHAKIAKATGAATDLTGPSNLPAVAAEQKAVSIPQPILRPVMSQSATIVSKVTTPPAGHPSMIYTVKSGDNLTRIAKLHATTVTAIKAANGLASDRIAIGTKLRMPQA